MAIFNNGPGTRVGMQVGTVLGNITVDQDGVVVTGVCADDDTNDDE